MRVCVCAGVGVWGLFMFLFQHMIYCPRLLGCLCASECVSAVSLCAGDDIVMCSPKKSDL